MSCCMTKYKLYNHFELQFANVKNSIIHFFKYMQYYPDSSLLQSLQGYLVTSWSTFVTPMCPNILRIWKLKMNLQYSETQAH